MNTPVQRGKALWAFIFTVLSRMVLVSGEEQIEGGVLNPAPPQQQELVKTVALFVIIICHLLFWEKAIRTILQSLLLEFGQPSSIHTGQIYLLDLAGNLDVSVTCQYLHEDYQGKRLAKHIATNRSRILIWFWNFERASTVRTSCDTPVT